MDKNYVRGDWQQKRAFSPAVVTTGGRTIWLAGHGATHDADGRTLSGDFEAQARCSFDNLARTLGASGGVLQDIVTMTVFLVDPRHGDRFIEIRKEYFPEDFPASALITVAGFAKPEMLVEIQAIAVVDN